MVFSYFRKSSIKIFFKSKIRIEILNLNFFLIIFFWFSSIFLEMILSKNQSYFWYLNSDRWIYLNRFSFLILSKNWTNWNPIKAHTVQYCAACVAVSSLSLSGQLFGFSTKMNQKSCQKKILFKRRTWKILDTMLWLLKNYVPT